MTNESESTKQSVEVFVSHSNEEVAETQNFVRQLKERGGDRLHFTLANDMLGGEDWHEKIEQEVANADLLFLLYIDPLAPRDWCIYEAGLFEGKKGIRFSEAWRQDIEGRVLVFHNPRVDLPRQLSHLQAIRATQRSMEEFLREFFGKSTYTGLRQPLNRAVAEDPISVQTLATVLCRLFEIKSASSRRIFTRYMALKVPDAGAMNSGTPPAVPDQAKVEGSEESFNSLFGLGKQPTDKLYWSWADIKKQAQHMEDGRWLRELEMAIIDASMGKLTDPVQSTFQTRRDGKIFRPLIHELDVGRGATQTFYIIFVEQLSKGATKAPSPYATLLSAIIMANRMHWEVCEKYLQETDTWWEHQAAQGYEEIYAALSNVEREAAFRERSEMDHRTDEDRLVYAFSDRAQRDEVRNNLRTQRDLKHEIGLYGDQKPLDVSSVKEALRKLLDTNKSLLNFVLARYHNVVSTEL